MTSETRRGYRLTATTPTTVVDPHWPTSLSWSHRSGVWCRVAPDGQRYEDTYWWRAPPPEQWITVTRRMGGDVAHTGAKT